MELVVDCSHSWSTHLELQTCRFCDAERRTPSEVRIMVAKRTYGYTGKRVSYGSREAAK